MEENGGAARPSEMAQQIKFIFEGKRLTTKGG